ncbi:hypothetical protein BDN71DRAFT_1506229 [Pleurotus eryngii]|uniref:Uncharacterized protein n=1 Tax=Pleurotus eryngii TaxID=5323 RepID=A0A9P5ZZC9_PLEER|nr:hypothetical protein BDN71DRAFT_1506229 [Pleurotus eryngii]
MRFVSVLLAACAVFSTTAAVNPGNNALNMGVSDNFELAIQKEYGPVVFDGLAKGGCDGWGCFGTVASAAVCLGKCVVIGSVTCVLDCIPTSELCPCINCFPDVITDFLHKLGICDAELRAELFSRVYLGLASDEEKRKAQEAGYTVSAFGA